MQSKDYFYHRNGKQYGPVPIEELQKMIKNKSLHETDLVSFKNSSNWVRAKTLPELFEPDEETSTDHDQATVYPHHFNSSDLTNKENLKWYSIGLGGIIFGLVLLALTSRNFGLIKTKNLQNDLKIQQAEINGILNKTNKEMSDTLKYVKEMEKNIIEDIKKPRKKTSNKESKNQIESK